MNRRDFITLIGGTAVGWPLAARAQQGEPMRRIGVLTAFTEEDRESKARIAAFRQGLQELGWTDGRNVQIDIRWAAGNADLYRRYAVELVALAPDVVLANGGVALTPLQQVTRTVPIVFVNVPDPVAAGFVASLARPGGNATGFTASEYSLSSKWLELLKEVVPRLTRVAVIRDPSAHGSIGQFAAIQAVAVPLGVELSPVELRDATEMQQTITAFAGESNRGLILTSAGSGVRRALVIALAARYRLPAIYPYRYHVIDGGLISYGPDIVDQYRRAAGYVDRILKGEKPADLPVQAPTKYELVINLKTAKALGLETPPTLLARADEVIE
jgi:putative ABC transport system substrate-binding protein